MKFNKKNKKGQEEMVGFALIIILVAVILLVFLSISLKKPVNQTIEQIHELDSFISSTLQYTSDCAQNNEIDYRTIRQLIGDCDRKEVCLDNRETCKVLETTLNEILDKGWNTQQGSKIKGYVLNISSNEKPLIGIQKGNLTSLSSKGTLQDLPDRVKIKFNVYYN